MDNALFEKRKENKTSNRDNRSRSRSETRNSNSRRDNSKSTERIVFPPSNNQNRSTKSQTEDNPKKYEKKRNIFSKGRSTSEKFETIVISTNGNNRNVRLAEQEHNEIHIIPETQLSQNDKGEDVQVSTEKNSFCSMTRVQYTEETIKNKSISKNT